MTNLQGAVVLVVGATGGLGSRIADQLESNGAVVARSSRSAGHDLREPSVIREVLETTHTQHGRLDGLVVASGVVAFGAASELETTTVDELFAVNTTSAIQLIAQSQSYLAASAQDGREPFVVTLSGVVAETPVAGLAAYSASKAGLAAFVVAAAREYRRSGIRILDARPGHTGTTLSEHPIAGTAPRFGAALDPDQVAARIVTAIVDGEKDLPSTAF
ncbi:cyclic-di-GMP-binding biofilm dispersal mediator protein [Labedella gwakjiensis]|uniref:Cyclic-di-GMP-binding biofilm dispersal mediator protein n=1 Tax=Labedella gwakjiensis TaxID=390269 RepID=A0A2P8H192_9MICO|nr:SDR family oxidoreductase [Labedella gwakjiensis]PSL39960.1 cyclic-di-GMP-binding biofilm dispersal mediator protein [Labedella gwakjiensis]RUQ85682.1 SDR family oxidoreductase [Labedella gwakjiensis]